jgi:hypothetical protein
VMMATSVSLFVWRAGSPVFRILWPTRRDEVKKT